MNLDELEARAVCGVVRNGGSQLVLEIRDRFWPYQKQRKPVAHLSRSGVRPQGTRLVLASVCVQAGFSAADEKIAAGLHRRGVSLQQVTRAILLGCAASTSP